MEGLAMTRKQERIMLGIFLSGFLAGIWLHKLVIGDQTGSFFWVLISVFGILPALVLIPDQHSLTCDSIDPKADAIIIAHGGYLKVHFGEGNLFFTVLFPTKTLKNGEVYTLGDNRFEYKIDHAGRSRLELVPT